MQILTSRLNLFRGPVNHNLFLQVIILIQMKFLKPGWDLRLNKEYHILLVSTAIITEHTICGVVLSDQSDRQRISFSLGDGMMEIQRIFQPLILK
jgi:hypothetical protein